MSWKKTYTINWGEVEGLTSIFLSIFILSPFIGLMLVTPWNNMYVYSSVPTFTSLRTTLTILIWNVNGYDMTTTYVHKVEDAEHKYFWAYVFNTIGIYCMMFLVFCLGTYYVHDTSEWSDGLFVSIASYHGVAFKWWMGLSALAASFGVLTAELCSTSYLYNGLYVLGFGKIFQNRQFNLLINLILLCCGVLIKLDTLISLSAILNTLTLVIPSLDNAATSICEFDSNICIIIRNVVNSRDGTDISNVEADFSMKGTSSDEVTSLVGKTEHPDHPRSFGRVHTREPLAIYRRLSRYETTLTKAHRG